MNASASPNWPSNLPEETLDLERLEEIAALEAFRPGLVQRLIGLFRDSLGQHLPRCVDLNCNDESAVKSSAHALKGAAASVGAERLARTAAAVEWHPADTAANSARAALPAEAERALDSLDRWSADLSSSHGDN